MVGILSDILFISRCHGQYQRQKAEGAPLTPMQLLLISRVCRDEGITPERLCREYALDKSRLTHHMNDLENAGYITRRVSGEDARKRLLFPTEKAKALYPEIRASHIAFAQGMLEGLSEEEVAVVTRATRIMRENAQRMMEEDK